MKDKKLLRKKFSEIRSNITEKTKKDILIRNSFIKQTENYDTLLLYASFGTEIDTFSIAEELFGKYTVAFPKSNKEGIMTFHVVKSTDELHKGMYGIYEPDTSLPCPVITDSTLCVMPGLAFMADGSRLGYGGGYYDRFLAKYPQIHKIALAYEELITDNLPVMQHDLKADYILTPERMIFCHAEQR
ncbi:MAG: 5-formyltetrahydrofolate cyclo-ligase [Ruminococcus sp.]|nr:5-formyltetrahydrofolate cyclo-ligase [Ruminococcus sp.]MDE6849424.1 5-formyltetrahydrofolate cyclo-ligase [Ruminococcus sp.]MDE7139017.1 5-formyltetrahydrofolate cyclo-ligase [Ruminococcus sp.]